MDNEKMRYTYRTDSERLKVLKIKSIEQNINANEYLDQAVDFFTKVCDVKTLKRYSEKYNLDENKLNLISSYIDYLLNNT